MKNANLFLLTASLIVGLGATNAFAKSSVPKALYNYDCSNSENADTITIHVNPNNTIGYAYIDEDKGKLTGAILDRAGYSAENPVHFTNEDGTDSIEVYAEILNGKKTGKIRVVGSKSIGRGTWECSRY